MISSALVATLTLRTSLLSASTSLLARAAEPAARSILLAFAVAVLLSVLRVKSVTPRLAAWKIVLYCALAMPVLGWVLPALPLSVPAPEFMAGSVSRAVDLAPALVARATEPRGAIESQSKASTAPAKSSRITKNPIRRNSVTKNDVAAISVAEPSRPASAAPAPKQVRADSLFTRWKAFAGALYVAVTMIFLARFLLGFVLSRRVSFSRGSSQENAAARRIRNRSRARHSRCAPLFHLASRRLARLG
jgi:hypothetical protein